MTVNCQYCLHVLESQDEQEREICDSCQMEEWQAELKQQHRDYERGLL